jgi:flavin-dependent dehydrogenase
LLLFGGNKRFWDTIFEFMIEVCFTVYCLRFTVYRLPFTVHRFPLTMHHQRFDVLIIGGGPAGSSAAIELARGGVNVALVEKRAFPREVLCGEFLSAEVIRAIRHFHLYQEFLALKPNSITGFAFTPGNGIHVAHPLGFEAWALKRSHFDHMLLKKAESCGARIVQPAEVTSLHQIENGHKIQCKTATTPEIFSATNVIAAYGRQNPLDNFLRRDFVARSSGLTGVKYHLPREVFADFPRMDVLLFAAKGVYCGINRISDNEATLCFLAARRNGLHHPTDALMSLVRRNESFGRLFQKDLFLELGRHRPTGSGNIYFGKRTIVENGVYMIGDAAAVIAPLSGDGIGMAIESGRLVARVLLQARRDSLDREQAVRLYTNEWESRFRTRLTFASFLQDAVMNSFAQNLGGRLVKTFPQLSRQIIHRTRG